MIPNSKQKKYTYADYLKFPEHERWEIINGVLYNMSPASSTVHQAISWEVSRQIGNFLADKECRGFSAPFDVRFPEGITIDEEIVDVVQPDISVVCDPSKIDERGCLGAPDFIIEILSPATASRDSIIKKELYEKNGVKEYWIIDPVHKLIIARTLEDGKYGIAKIYEGKGEVNVLVIDRLIINFDLVFSDSK